MQVLHVVLFSIFLTHCLCHTFIDCNKNNVSDHLDISNLTSKDCNYNGTQNEFKFVNFDHRDSG